EEVVAVIRDVLAWPKDRLPQLPRHKPAAEGSGAAVDLMKVLLKLVAEREGVASKVLATVDDLEAIAADDAADVPALAGWRRGRAAVVDHARRHWLGGLVGGAASVASYALALWAMTQAPIAVVAALRETSILFAVGLGIVVLGEKASVPRLFAAGTIAMGALVLKLG
ncbi:EamA family transporter, partial [Mycobacterium tuberculosis]|nr:EamA family transporter [Mycobacterium tuberculosis]